MSDVPSEALREILLRVPAESLFCFRAVCKAWRRIIDDPYFVETHSNNELFTTAILIRGTTTRLFSLSLDSLKYDDGRQTIEATPVKPFICRGLPRLPELPVGSCNGLVLISDFELKKTWLLWNPLTRDFHVLPNPNNELNLPKSNWSVQGSGLGYDFATHDYKVVRIDVIERYRNGKFVYRTLVYSLKLDSWKVIKNCPFDFMPWTSGVFLNGALHWTSSEMIVKLDLGTEEFSQLPLPVPLPDVPLICFRKYLDVLGGFLFLSYPNEFRYMDGWIMKDCRVESSWTKMFTLKKPDYHMSGMWNLRPVAYLESKGLIVLQHDSKFLLLDIEKNSVKKVKIRGFPDTFSDFSCQICPGSLFRLSGNYDVCRTVAMKRTRAQRKRANARLKLSARITDTWYSDYKLGSCSWSDCEDDYF